MTSSSLLVPNSFSSWPLGALSYAPCAPWLFTGKKEAFISKGSGNVERVVGPGKPSRGAYLCVTKILNAETK